MRTTILLVEDEAVSRRALTAFLEDEGYSVEVVANGDAALRLLGDHHSFDAVITNLELDGSVNGLDVLSILSEPIQADAKSSSAVTAS